MKLIEQHQIFGGLQVKFGAMMPKRFSMRNEICRLFAKIIRKIDRLV